MAAGEPLPYDPPPGRAAGYGARSPRRAGPSAPLPSRCQWVPKPDDAPSQIAFFSRGSGLPTPVEAVRSPLAARRVQEAASCRAHAPVPPPPTNRRRGRRRPLPRPEGRRARGRRRTRPCFVRGMLRPRCTDVHRPRLRERHSMQNGDPRRARRAATNPRPAWETSKSLGRTVSSFFARIAAGKIRGTPLACWPIVGAGPVAYTRWQGRGGQAPAA